MISRFFPSITVLAALSLGGGVASGQSANYVTVGPGAGSNPSGAMTLFATSGGSATLTVGNISYASTVTIPTSSLHTTGNFVIDSLNNAFSGLNDFTFGSVILPNTASFAPTAAGQVAYNTSQQDFVGLGNQSVAGSFRRVLSVAVPSSDAICSLHADSITGITCNNRTQDGIIVTAFTTTFAVPANFLIAGKRLVFTADFKIFNTASGPTVTAGMVLDSATGEALYLSAALSTPPAAHSSGLGYSGSWALTGTAAAGSSAATIANTLGYNLPGAALLGAANTIPQPPSGWSTNAAHSIVFTIQYGGTAATAGNAIQLQTLTVEELN